VNTGQPLMNSCVRLMVHETLQFFLGREAGPPLTRTLREKTSVKDVIESCGIPHPEVNLILVNGTPVDFNFPLQSSAEVEVFGIEDSPAAFVKAQLQTRSATRFVADGHLGKLARHLRSLGVDVAYDHSADDPTLLAIMEQEARALLTRDRRLLMHSVVHHGYYPRSQFAEQQTREVIQRFDLRQKLAPLTRCLRCNALLMVVTKSEIDAQLEPLTRLYYENFRRCPNCGRIFWRGSHFQKLEERVARLVK